MQDARAVGRLGWKSVVVVAAFYAAIAVVATLPRAARIGLHLPSTVDPLHHLWIMQWWKTCLPEGGSPVLCPEIHSPVGAPMGNFSPLYVQSLLYLPLSLVLRNDVLCYNLIWFAGLVFTGMGTFALAWSLLRDRASACFAGMLAMLSTPVLLHARDHLDVIFAGGMPLFLAAWTRFVGRPTRGRCLSSAGAYVLVAACHPYHMVFVTVPAALYVGWRGIGAIRRRDRAWIASRGRWLACFAAAIVPPVGLLYANHAWAMAHGYTLDRPMDAFADYGAPLWSYVIPTSHHHLGRVLLSFDVYASAGIPDWTIHERGSYLGVVTLLLLHRAAVHRASLPRGRFWWALPGGAGRPGVRGLPAPGIGRDRPAGPLAEALVLRLQADPGAGTVQPPGGDDRRRDRRGRPAAPAGRPESPTRDGRLRYALGPGRGRPGHPPLPHHDHPPDARLLRGDRPSGSGCDDLGDPAVSLRRLDADHRGQLLADEAPADDQPRLLGTDQRPV